MSTQCGAAAILQQFSAFSLELGQWRAATAWWDCFQWASDVHGLIEKVLLPNYYLEHMAADAVYIFYLFLFLQGNLC